MSMLGTACAAGPVAEGSPGTCCRPKTCVHNFQGARTTYNHLLLLLQARVRGRLLVLTICTPCVAPD